MKRRNFFKWSLAAIGIGSIPKPVNPLIVGYVDHYEGWAIFEDFEVIYRTKVAQAMVDKIDSDLTGILPTRWSENDMVKGIMEKIKRSKYERISLLEETRNSALQK